MDLISVDVKTQSNTADTDVIEAFGKGGEVVVAGAAPFRFDWFPILAELEGQPKGMPASELSSTITRERNVWRWSFDPYPLVTGPVLWRTANALRLLALLGHLKQQAFCIGWHAEFRGVVIAAGEASRGAANPLLITGAFTELIAGDAGEAVFAAMRTQLGDAIRREDRLTSESERRSSLIASFIEDQLAVRPPISQNEIDDLKRRLGLS